MDLTPFFGAATREWFRESFPEATRVQREGWPAIASGQHTLLVAPTGSGKTLAAFLCGIDRVAHGVYDVVPGVKVLYVSPLKALVHDIERNLRAPLVGVQRAALNLGTALRPVRIDVRTGDTTAQERRRQAKEPGDVLITTPESLYLLLTSSARESLRTVQTVILDEIHVMAGTKRGVHLALSLERLSELTGRDPQRIGLSATQRPLERVARYLGGDRPVTLVDASEPPRLELEISVPVDDMENPGVPDGARPEEPEPRGRGGTGWSEGKGGKKRGKRSGSLLGAAGRDVDASALLPDGGYGDGIAPAELGPGRTPPGERGIWPTIYPKLLELIRAHRSTIVFVNSRLLCERLAKKLNEAAGEELVRTHHGSLSHERRQEVEELLKGGHVKGLVATSSLELGIDMGAVDLVVLVESPGSVASGLQRIGRAGHQVGEVSRGKLFPKFRGDLLEAAVIAEHMKQGRVEETRLPKNCLDVLAQHVVAMCALEDRSVDDVERLVRRTASFAELSRDVLEKVLDMLSGRFPSDAFADLTPRLTWDRTTNMLSARRGSRALAVLNAGTIPDRGTYTVHLGEGGPRLGELDEEMVYETRRGDTLVLGASTWRVEEITRDRVLVTPAPGEPGRLPFWRGERPGRPIELGRDVGAFVRALSELDAAEAARWIEEHTPLDPRAAKNLLAYLQEQKEATGTLPTDRAITVERFRDELGDWRVCVLTPFGSRVHTPWALALEARLSREAGFDVQVLYSDDGIALRLADTDDVPDISSLFPEPEEIEDLVISQLSHSALFSSRFRENAARALLLPRRRFQGRAPLWLQRRRSSELLGVASRFPDFPIVLETYRECLQDIFDLPALKDVLEQVRRREVRVDDVETRTASPFARSLVFQYVAAYLYDGDAPLAERKAQALALDRSLLRELLGQEELRELLDADAVVEVERELQHLTEERRARHKDALHDLLRRLGDLSLDEVRARYDGDASAALAELLAERRALEVRVAGAPRYLAVEDAGRYRDALGVALPVGVPKVFLEEVEAPLESLLTRYARTRGPFLHDDVAARFGLPPGVVAALLGALVQRGALVEGEIRPGGTRRELCDPEVLRRLKRRSLAKLRDEVAPVDPEVYARFLPAWHGIGEKRSGMDRLLDVVDQLEGLPLPFSTLVDEALPARVPGFTLNDLDTLGATGAVVWIGRGALGPKDGRVALHRRERVPLLVDAPAAGGDGELDPSWGPAHHAVLEHLGQRGASFFSELGRVSGLVTKDLLEVLWDLAWAGLVTNDTFQPLRGLRAKSGGRRPRELQMVGGRWSLVRDLVGTPPPETERLHARVNVLLERYGVVSRDAALASEVPGGFSAIYPVLRAMEESGVVRRGHFLEGVGGAQFALPGVVDRLRAMKDGEQEVLVLAAADPANAWGSVLPWPEGAVDGQRPRRVAGARVALFGGRPVLFVEKGAKSIVTFPALDDGVDLARVIEALASLERRSITLLKVDGVEALKSERAAALLQAGFSRDYRGLVYSR